MKKRVCRLVGYYTRICGSNDPFRIANHLGIYVNLCPLGATAGTYTCIQKGQWIFINSDIEDENFRNIVMAHELGHALLHRKENCCFMSHHTLILTTKIERQANLFAAHLLITNDMLLDYAGCTEDQFCRSTGYSKELIRLRLK